MPSSNPISTLAIVGPGRVGQALGRRVVEAGPVSGFELTGFLGRSIQTASAAVAFAGGGRVLDDADLAKCDLVLLAVQDDQLPSAVERFRRYAARGLWIHCSGSQERSVLAPLHEAGARSGSLHPLCPFPDAEVGYQQLVGRPAVIEVAAGDDSAQEQLERLARAAGLQPICLLAGGDRLLYHAACVLAANGLTALHAIVDDLLRAALPGAEAAAIPSALMEAALLTCREHGAVQALSGPVLRGDALLIERQHRHLAEVAPETEGVYLELMQKAIAMAAERGALTGEALTAMQAALSVRR